VGLCLTSVANDWNIGLLAANMDLPPKYGKNMTISRLQLLAAAAFCVSNVALADSLTVNIEGISSAEGVVLIALMDSADAYDNDGEPVQAWRVPADESGTAVVEATDIEPGEYGVRVMHDVNDNGKMDTNLMGIPKEPYGMSNNARGSFGPPKWSGIAFQVEGDTNITINLSK